jgi:predicted metal-binding protein
MSKTLMVCKACASSEDIVRQARARWNVVNGKWDLIGFDDVYVCDHCGAVEQPLTVDITDDLLDALYNTLKREPLRTLPAETLPEALQVAESAEDKKWLTRLVSKFRLY